MEDNTREREKEDGGDLGIVEWGSKGREGKEKRKDLTQRRRRGGAEGAEKREGKEGRKRGQEKRDPKSTGPSKRRVNRNGCATCGRSQVRPLHCCARSGGGRKQGAVGGRQGELLELLLQGAVGGLRGGDTAGLQRLGDIAEQLRQRILRVGIACCRLRCRVCVCA